MDDRALIDASVANIVAAYEAVARHASWPVERLAPVRTGDRRVTAT